jgi:myo-inositol-1(or 4)-monophosphatase
VTVIDFGAFVDRLAAASGETLLPFFRTALGVENKGPVHAFDPVTEADRAAESVMRRLIHDSFPSHGIVGEEFGTERPDAEYVWVLDPIDGTKSFIAGMPIWGTLIGLQHNGTPVFGLMHQPYIRACAGLNEATLFTTSPLLMNEADRASFARVEAKARLSRYGGDCYAYCMLAAGHIDLIIETELKPYDVAALVPIITGAGGLITTWEGRPAQNGGRIVAAGDKRVHNEAMALLATARIAG